MEKRLLKIMSRLGIRQEEILEKFIRSSAPGGQNVNKTSTCVYLKHIPTGIEVKCQEQRSQVVNRYLAHELLLEKIENLRLREISQQRQQLEKIRRQKRPRPKRLKLKILEAKRRQAEKKKMRASIRDIEK